MTQILGVIGGSGIDKIDELVFIKNHKIDTPWGKPVWFYFRIQI